MRAGGFWQWWDFRPSVWKTLCALARGHKVILSPAFQVRGWKGIRTHSEGFAKFGVRFYGFTGQFDTALIRVRGRLLLGRSVGIGPGVRLDIAESATLSIGDRSYLSPNVKVLVVQKVSIGEDCAIGWDTQIMDSSFHALIGAESEETKPVVIGNHVWIGSRATILPGVSLAPGTVVAANSTVTRSVETENCLVAGSPARIVRQAIHWS